MNELHLFSGAGGGILGGILLGHRTVCAVEIEEHPRNILLQRQRDGLLPWFPVWDDIRTFDGRPWRGIADIVCGGFPCQDISVAGKGKGLAGERSGLWSEMARVVSEVRPKYVFVENSPMLTGRGLDRVLMDLALLGYDARWCVLGADDAGAPHKRKRIWVLAYRSSKIKGNTSCTNPNSIGSHRTEMYQCGSEQGRVELRNKQECKPGSMGKKVAHAHDTGERTSPCRADGEREEVEQGREGKPWAEPGGLGEDVADPDVIGRHGAVPEGHRAEKRQVGEDLPDHRDGVRGQAVGCGEPPQSALADPVRKRGSAGTPDQEGREEGEPAEPVDGSAPGGVPGIGWWAIDPADLPEFLAPGKAGVRYPDCEDERAKPEVPGNGTASDPCGGCPEGIGEVGAAEPGLGGMADELACWLDLLESAYGGQVPRVAEGIEKRIDRLKAIGNGQVPLVAAIAFTILTEGLEC